MPDYVSTLAGLAVPRSALERNGHALASLDETGDGFAPANLVERMAELELAAEDFGWLREAAYTDRDFSRDGLKRIIRNSRLSYLKNPLIQRGVKVQAYYVFGQGVDIAAQDPDVNDLIQTFLSDKLNQSTFSSHESRVNLETELQVCGNLFFAFFTSAATGALQVRTIPVDEILDVICNPDDATEPWYYRREYTRSTLDLPSGLVTPSVTVAYYPDWRYQPDVKPATFGSAPIHWDVPVYHVKVGGLRDMKFGVPEVYAALDWARAVKSDLEDYATTKRALSRFAWQMTTTGGAKGVAAAKTKLSTTMATNSDGQYIETNPPPVTGSTFISGGGTQMTPMRVAGAQPNPDEGRRLWLMVASAMGLPETFFGEASVGSHATAKTLDRPTELKMRDRQILWVDVIKDILEYVIEQDALAPGGTLQGSLSLDANGKKVVSLGVDADGDELSRLVEVTFPPILDRDIVSRVASVAQAITLGGFGSAGTFDKRTAVQLLLQALGEDDINQTLDRLAPDDGTPLLPPHDPNAAPPGAFGVPGPDAPGATSPPAALPPGVSAHEARMVEAARRLRAMLQEVG